MFNDEKPVKDFTTATFKTTRVVIGQSSENLAKGNLNFIISHHFGKVNLGASEFFGLDQSTIRLGVEYGILDVLTIGVGRSSFEKTIDGYVKYKILRQQKNKVPLSITYFADMTLNSSKWKDPNRKNYFTSKLAYVHQLIIGRKFNNYLSFQLVGSYIHKNLVERSIDQNDSFTLGLGGRCKISNRVTVNAEYHYIMPGQTAKDFNNSLSLGVDIETGGHVFQVFLTNSHPLFERGFLTETVGRWEKGDIMLGFNIVRTFTIFRPKIFKEKHK